MTISNYLFHVIGESPKKAGQLHASTLKRMKAFAIAIHIPVMLWAITGYVIAAEIFKLASPKASCVAMLCSALIYLVERLVLATPKIWYVNLGRVMIGIVIALLGASTVDLVIFDREVSQQLRDTVQARIKSEYETITTAKVNAVEQSKADWFRAQEAANCEANGTCGSRTRNVGPVYRELANQAERLRKEYVAAQARLELVEQERDRALSDFRSSSEPIAQAGLLARIEALHQYTVKNTAAFFAWLLFFTLVLFLELMVVITKLVFGETVDDQLEAYRERISQHKAANYLAAITSPVANARELMRSTCC